MNGYLGYVTFKVANFLEIYQGVRILKFTTDFVLDENNVLYFIGCSKLEFNKFHKENRGEMFKNVMKDPSLMLKENIDKYYKNLQKKEVQGLIADILFKDYNQRKQKENLISLRVSKPDDLLNEEIFHKLHPFTPYKLQDLLNSTNSPQAIFKLRDIVKNGLTPVKPTINFDVINKNTVTASKFIRKSNKKAKIEPPPFLQTPTKVSHTKNKSSHEYQLFMSTSPSKFFPKLKSEQLRKSTVPSIVQTSTVICKYQINHGNNISQIKLSGNIYRRLRLNEQKRKAATINTENLSDLSDAESNHEETPKMETQSQGAFFPTTTASSVMEKNEFSKRKKVSNYFQWKISKKQKELKNKRKNQLI